MPLPLPVPATTVAVGVGVETFDDVDVGFVFLAAREEVEVGVLKTAETGSESFSALEKGHFMRKPFFPFHSFSSSSENSGVTTGGLAGRRFDDGRCFGSSEVKRRAVVWVVKMEGMVILLVSPVKEFSKQFCNRVTGVFYIWKKK
jgi:hypothetical protein